MRQETDFDRDLEELRRLIANAALVPSFMIGKSDEEELEEHALRLADVSGLSYSTCIEMLVYARLDGRDPESLIAWWADMRDMAPREPVTPAKYVPWYRRWFS